MMAAVNTESSDDDARSLSSDSWRSKKQIPNAEVSSPRSFTKIIIFITVLLIIGAVASFFLFFVNEKKFDKSQRLHFNYEKLQKKKVTLSVVRPINYTLSLDIRSSEKIRGRLSVAFFVETTTNYLVMRAGSYLFATYAGIAGKEFQLAVNVTKKDGFVRFYFREDLTPNNLYVLKVTYESRTTNNAGEGLYIMDVRDTPDVLFSIRDLTSIDYIVPVFNINSREAVWTLNVTVPADTLVYSTAPYVGTKSYRNDKKTIVFAPTPPIVAADLTLIIGSNKTIWIKEITNPNYVCRNKNGTLIRMHLIGLVNSRHIPIVYLVHGIKMYLEQYPFYNFEQLGILVFNNQFLSKYNVLSKRYFTGGSIIASSFQDVLINMRILARLLFGQHLYANTDDDNSVLYALADYSTYLVLDNFLDQTIKNIRFRTIQHVNEEEDYEDENSNASGFVNPFKMIFPQDELFDTDRVIVGLHALAQLVRVDNFVGYLKTFVARSPANTHFTRKSFAQFIQLSIKNAITCDNKTETPFDVSKYLSHLVSNKKYLNVSVITQKDHSVLLIQEPFNDGAVPLRLQDSEGGSKPFVLCSPNYTISTPELTVNSLDGFYELSFSEASINGLIIKKSKSKPKRDVSNGHEMLKQMNLCKKLHRGSPERVSLCIKRQMTKLGSPFKLKKSENGHNAAILKKENPLFYKNL